MRRWMRHIWLRRPARPGRSVPRRGGKGLPALIGVGLALLLILPLDALLSQSVLALASAQVQALLSEEVNAAVAYHLEEYPLSYENLVSLQVGEDGTVQTLTSDPFALNQLRAQLVEEVSRRLHAMEPMTVSLPLGNLTGVSVLGGYGPSIQVQLLSVSVAGAELRNEFSEAGINQTLHRIWFDVTASATLVLPGHSLDIQTKVPVCVAETILVGQVPQTYVHISGGTENP